MGCILSHFFTPISHISNFPEQPKQIQSFVSNLIAESYVEKCPKCSKDWIICNECIILS